MGKLKPYPSSLDKLFTDKSEVENNKYIMSPFVQKPIVCFHVLVFD